MGDDIDDTYPTIETMDAWNGAPVDSADVNALVRHAVDLASEGSRPGLATARTGDTIVIASPRSDGTVEVIVAKQTHRGQAAVRCPATKRNDGHVYTCRLPAGHDGAHRGGEGVDRCCWAQRKRAGRSAA